MSAVDGSRLLDVQRLAGGDADRVIDDDDPAYVPAARECMSDGATDVSGSDDAGSRHESVEYSS